jgi:hypothetical protein
METVNIFPFPGVLEIYALVYFPEGRLLGLYFSV